MWQKAAERAAATFPTSRLGQSRPKRRGDTAAVSSAMRKSAAFLADTDAKYSGGYNFVFVGMAKNRIVTIMQTDGPVFGSNFALDRQSHQRTIEYSGIGKSNFVLRRPQARSANGERRSRPSIGFGRVTFLPRRSNSEP
jgi:hypothetical protein